MNTRATGCQLPAACRRRRLGELCVALQIDCSIAATPTRLALTHSLHHCLMQKPRPRPSSRLCAPLSNTQPGRSKLQERHQSSATPGLELCQVSDAGSGACQPHTGQTRRMVCLHPAQACCCTTRCIKGLSDVPPFNHRQSSPTRLYARCRARLCGLIRGGRHHWRMALSPLSAAITAALSAPRPSSRDPACAAPDGLLQCLRVV